MVIGWSFGVSLRHRDKPGASDIAGWTSASSATQITREGLTLSENQSYYFSVEAGNGLGAWSLAANSDGIGDETDARIQEAKALANNEVRAIRGGVVSAVFADCFYIQEQGQPWGIKVTPLASVLDGQEVDVVGSMRGAHSERYIDCSGNAVSRNMPTLALSARRRHGGRGSVLAARS